MGGSPCFIDLYCGPGRIQIRDTQGTRYGGALAALDASINSPRGKARPFDKIFIADLESTMVEACEQRLIAMNVGRAIDARVGSASDTATAIARELPRRGIHIAYLDPYSLFALPYTVLQAFSKAGNVDLVIHFAAADMSRNLQRPDLWDRFDAVAPGWQSVVGNRSGKAEVRRRFFEYWLSLVRRLGYGVGHKARQVNNSKGREIYRLVLASKHPLGANIWDSLRDSAPQQGLWG